MVKPPQDHRNLVTGATVRWDLRAAARRSFWSPGCRVPQSRWCHCHPWLVEQLEIGIYFHQQKCVFFTIEMGYYGEVTGHIFFPQKLTGICGNDVDVRLTPWTPYCLAKKRRGDFVGYKYTAKENMNEICNLSQLNALFAEGKKNACTMAQNWGHRFGSRAANFSIVAPTQYGQQVCYCRRKLTAAQIRDTPRVHAGEACFTIY